MTSISMYPKMFCRIYDDDEFMNWCFDNGIYKLPSGGSKIADKLGLTKADIDKMHRFDVDYQLDRMVDFLLSFHVPILALMSKVVTKVQYFILDIRYKDVSLDKDLDL